MKRVTDYFMKAVIETDKEHPEYTLSKHEYAVFSKMFDYEIESFKLKFSNETERQIYKLICWRMLEYGCTYDYPY